MSVRMWKGELHTCMTMLNKYLPSWDPTTYTCSDCGQVSDQPNCISQHEYNKVSTCHSCIPGPQIINLLHAQLKWEISTVHKNYNMQVSRPGGGKRVQTPPPWKITKIKGFLPILVQISRKITKLPSQHSIMLGHHRHASKTQFKWCFAGGPMMTFL